MNTSLLKIPTSHTSEELSKTGIYALICKPTGKMYIGQTRRNFLRRWLEHQGLLFKKKHSSYIQNAFNKYGYSEFEFRILEFLPASESNPIEWYNKREVFWIAHYKELFGEKFLFNLNSGGDGNSGPTEEYRLRISEERTRRWKNPEYKKKVSASCKGHRTEDPRKISERSRRLWQDPEYRKKITGNRGHKLSEEKKKERSQVIHDYFKDTEHRKKTSSGVKRYFATVPNARKKRSESAKKVYETNSELRRQISNTSKELWSSIEYRIKMYKARGLRVETVWIDYILSTVYELYPKLRHRSLKSKIHLINQICKLHS